MTYIGQQPATTFDAGIQDRFTGLSTNTVTLTHEIAAEEDILVVWNNIVQDKNTYSVGGTGNKTVTLGGTLVSADVVTVYYLNKVMQSVNPTAGSVGITELNVSDGSNGQALTTNGSGTLSFSDTGLDGVTTGSGNVTITNGNLVIGTAGKGIDFSATSDGAGTDTSELLDDYEEGTWSPALGNFGGSSESFIAPRYTKIGRLVTVSCQLQIGSFPSDGSTFLITGLPYTCKNDGGTTFGTVPFRYTGTNVPGLTIGDNNTQIEMYQVGNSGGQFNYNDFGQSKQMAFVAQYETA